MLEIDRFEVQRLLTRGAQLVDVQPAREYERRHIAGAVNVPLDELRTAVVRARLDARRPLITYCSDLVCDRSGRAAALLRTLGFTEVYNYQASMADWVGNGLPVEGRDAERPQLGDLARADVPTCRPDETVAEVRERMDGWDVCLVVDDDDILLGLVRADALNGNDAQNGNGHRPVADLMQEGPTTYRPDTPVEDAAEILRDSPEPRVIVSNADGVMVGVADAGALRQFVRSSSERG